MIRTRLVAGPKHPHCARYGVSLRVVEARPVPPERKAIEILLSIDREIAAGHARATFRLVNGQPEVRRKQR